MCFSFRLCFALWFHQNVWRFCGEVLSESIIFVPFARAWSSAALKMAQPSSLQLGDYPSANSDIDIDRFSHLPMGIHDNILGKLPICDAARTSVLSHAWRYKWLGQSTLLVDSHGILDSREKMETDKRPCCDDDRHQLSPQSPSEYPKILCTCLLRQERAWVYGWLLKLSRSKVKEFLLEELDHRHFWLPLPSYLFTFNQLRSLQLSRCIVELPPNFSGFIFLIELSLNDISMKHEDVMRLILLCQAIERLTLVGLKDSAELTITAPALKYLFIDSAFQDVILEYAPKLSSVHLVRTLDHQKSSVHWLIRCLSNLPSLEQLHLDGGYALLWAKPVVLNHFPLRNEHLSIFILDGMTFDTLDVLMVCLSLLQFCPNIHTFNFSVKSTCSRTAAWFFIQDPVHIHFRHLRNVTFRYYHQIGVALDFLCFLIRQSPILEHVTIVKDTDCLITKETVKRIFSRLKQRAPNTNAVFKFLCKEKPIDVLSSSRKRSRDDVASELTLWIWLINFCLVYWCLSLIQLFWCGRTQPVDWTSYFLLLDGRQRIDVCWVPVASLVFGSQLLLGFFSKFG